MSCSCDDYLRNSFVDHVFALFKSPSGGGLTKMGSVTFWGPLETSFLFAQIVGARWPQKTSVFGPQNLALCEVLGSKCDKNKCGKHSGKFVSNLFLRDKCRLLQRLLNNAKRICSCGIKLSVRLPCLRGLHANLCCVSVLFCEGLIRHRPPRPHPRIRLALPSSGVDLASI